VSRYRLIHGDVRAVLPTLEDGSVHCCVTSPPYWGLRDYGTPGQIGLEATPDEYVSVMVAVFREVRRVLRDDGTAWVNMGDGYAGGGHGGGGSYESERNCRKGSARANGVVREDSPRNRDGLGRVSECKPKDLIGMPWLLAFALRADDWYLRSDIIWHKPNPMPESVADRPTKSHEYIFLLSKSARYYYDAEGIAEPLAESTEKDRIDGHLYRRDGQVGGADKGGGRLRSRLKMPPIGGIKHAENGHNGTLVGNEPEWPDARNKRTVWTVATQPFPEAHFATFPEKLIEPCILAGCPVGGTVLDPFNGAATTGVVSLRHGRNYIGIDNNAEYLAMSERRMEKVAPLFTARAGA
jgi:DNA modification methylase